MKKPIVKKPIIKKPIVKKPPVVVVPPGVTTTQNSLPTATTAGTPDTAAPAAISPVGGGSAPAVLATILLTLTTLLFGGLALLPRVPAARSALTKDRLLVLDRHRYELTALAAVGGLTLLVLLAI